MPRKARKFSRCKRNTRKQKIVARAPSTKRSSKRKQWSDQQMRDAMEAASSTDISANKAADMYGVPRSTLKDRLSGRVIHGVKPGPRPYLRESEERELVDHLKELAQIGLGKTRGEVLRIAESVAESKGILKGVGITNGWWRRFLERNPGMTLRAGDPTAGVRLDAINDENMNNYFDLLEEVYGELDFGDHPERIYNMDETGMPLDPRPPKIIAPKGQKKVRYRCSGQKSQITVIGCGSATGQAIPPFIIFAAKQLSPLWMKDEVPGSRYAVSDNGWIDQELFHFWLAEHFLTHAVASRPLLLLLDGHSSHFKPETIRYAKEHNIVVFCLPPHTTHECQPLDCSLFGPLKARWRSVCHSFHQQHPTSVISKLNFCRLFRQAWVQAVTPEVVSSGFRKAGVYPLNRARISVLKEKDNTTIDNDGDPSSGGEGELDSNSGGDGSSAGDGNPLGDDPLSIVNSQDDTGKENILSVEKELLYTRRFEEGCDIFDPEYVHWLKKHHPEAVPAGYTTPGVSSPEVSSKPKATPFADLSNRISTSNSSSGSGQSSSSSSTVSKFVGPLPERTPSRPSTTKSSGARVLTSAECLSLLEEKEEKKKKDKEEKEQRKLTREINKKKREEEQKKRAEERARKAAERQAEKERKEAEKVAKQAAKAADKAAKQAAKESRQGGASTSRKRPVSSDSTQDRTRQKAPRLSALDYIDPNQCCSCFGLYEDDVGTGCEWLQCCCSRWIHEDCVEDIVRSEDGEEKICPICLSEV